MRNTRTICLSTWPGKDLDTWPADESKGGILLSAEASYDLLVPELRGLTARYSMISWAGGKAYRHGERGQSEAEDEHLCQDQA
jgi:hypothetical protein